MDPLRYKLDHNSLSDLRGVPSSAARAGDKQDPFVVDLLRLHKTLAGQIGATMGYQSEFGWLPLPKNEVNS